MFPSGTLRVNKSGETLPSSLDGLTLLRCFFFCNVCYLYLSNITIELYALPYIGLLLIISKTYGSKDIGAN
jgi:hypothetical protein